MKYIKKKMTAVGTYANAEKVHDSTKINMFCPMLQSEIYSPFFF
jgi:hypothetical protein